MNKAEPRGIRNNNPGNIRRSQDRWLGLAGDQTDRAFFQFKDAKFGVRALVIVMRNYKKLYKLDTINELISRWAPATENNTASYVAAVSKSMNRPASQMLDLNDRATLTALAKAIIQHENGQQPYSDAVFIEALNLAGIVDKEPVTVIEPLVVNKPKTCPCCGQEIKS